MKDATLEIDEAARFAAATRETVLLLSQVKILARSWPVGVVISEIFAVRFAGERQRLRAEVEIAHLDISPSVNKSTIAGRDRASRYVRRNGANVFWNTRRA